MLTIPVEKVAYIIIKAREYEAQVPPVGEESSSNPADDDGREVLEEGPDNPIRQELVDAIDGLSGLERVEILALMWLGRGDFSKEEWRDALREAQRVHDEKETEYLVGTPLLAEYLQDGLAQLGYSISDYEAGHL
jgi:hypothetical protein